MPSSSSFISMIFLPCRADKQGRFVDEVGQVGAGEARRLRGQGVQVDLLADGLAARVHLEDHLAAGAVRPVDHDLAVEAARAQQRRVEDVGAVGGGDEDDVVLHLEAVHLDEQLVQRLLALVVSTAETSSPVAAHGVDLVHEDDAGRVLLGLVEQVAHARGADADEHLDEVRARDGEERHARLAGDGPGQQGLAGAGRAVEQHALGDAGAELLELLGVLQELLDLVELLDGFVGARHVLERDLGRIDAHPFGPALAEAHHLGAAALHAAHHEHHEGDDEDDRQQQAEEGARPRRAPGLGRDHDLRMSGQQLGEERGIGVADGVGGPVLGSHLDRLSRGVDEHGRDVAVGEVADEALAVALVGVADGATSLSSGDHLHHDEKDEHGQHGDDEAPQSAQVGLPASRLCVAGRLLFTPMRVTNHGSVRSWRLRAFGRPPYATSSRLRRKGRAERASRGCPVCASPTGASTVSITLDTCSHAIPAMQEEAAV